MLKLRTPSGFWLVIFFSLVTGRDALTFPQQSLKCRIRPTIHQRTPFRVGAATISRRANSVNFEDKFTVNEDEGQTSPPLIAERAEVRRLSLILWRQNWISWWCQTILTVVASVTLSFAKISVEGMTVASTAGFGLSSMGLFVSFVSIYWTWGNTRLANKIRLKRVEPGDVVRVIRSRLRKGVCINLVGQALTLLSAEQLVGILISRVLSFQGGVPGYFGAGAQNALRPLDIFIVQANTNALLSHFCSLAIGLYLTTRISTPSPPLLPTDYE